METGETSFRRIAAPTLIVTTQESGLQSVEEAVKALLARKFGLSKSHHAAERTAIPLLRSSPTLARGLRLEFMQQAGRAAARAAE